MNQLTSVNNPYIKSLAKLHNSKTRKEEKKFLVEGEHLVSEAYKTNHLEAIIYSDLKYKIDGVKNIYVTENIIKKLSLTKTPQQVMGVCSFISEKVINPRRFLLIDNIQDPGNLGTLLRSCLGFNIDFIYLNNETVDIYNDKVIRASQGAIFHLDFTYANLEEVIPMLKSHGVSVYGTDVTSGVDLEDIEVPSKYAIILGNEGSGVNPKILNKTNKNIYIKTNPQLESLNVGVAGSIILYHFDKKRIL